MPPILQKQPDLLKTWKNSVFFLIDTSSRMSGQAIVEVNVAMREAIQEVQKLVQDCADDIDIDFNVLEFNTTIRWTYVNRISWLKSEWLDLEGHGLRSLGEAFIELNNKLSTKKGGFLKVGGNYAPTIILVLAGTPTDDVESGLAVLHENKWFQSSVKVAIEFREVDDFDFHHQILVDFADKKGIIFANLHNLKKQLRNIAINASVVGCGHRFITNII